MITPAGLGGWIAYPKMIGKGDPKAIVDEIYQLGFEWVAARGSDGAHVDAGCWTKEMTEACNQEGIHVYRWPFSHPSSWQGEVELAKRWRDEGDSGFIIDAEIAWETQGDHRAEASRYGEALRAALTEDHFIADAPWPYVSYHPGFPFVEFGAFCDARMPQLYWTEISSQGAAHHIDKVDAEWNTYHQGKGSAETADYLPIGITYGRREMQAWGAKQLPPGEISVADVSLFLSRYAGKAVSLYSVEASGDVIDALLSAYGKAERKRKVELAAAEQNNLAGTSQDQWFHVATNAMDLATELGFFTPEVARSTHSEAIKSAAAKASSLTPEDQAHLARSLDERGFRRTTAGMFNRT